MKFFTNKKFLFKLIATLCVCFSIFNFCLAPRANAEGLITLVGGKLLDPVCDLLLVLGDGLMEVLQKSIMGTSATAIFKKTDGAFWKTALRWIITIAAIVVVGVLTAGVGPVLLAAAKVVGVAIVVYALTGVNVMAAVSAVDATFFGDNIVFPTYTIGPEEIFQGKILLFDPNIFNPKELKSREEVDSDGEQITTYYYEKDGEEIPTSTNNAAQELKSIISKWYYIIRNIAIVGLMLVLLYVGIRMLISSIAAEKAKYKQMMSDWVVALCLVFLMQYIMVFANSFVEGVTDIFSSLSENKLHVVTIKEPTDTLVEEIKKVNEEYVQEIDGGGNVITWPTNLMGRIRFEAQECDGTPEYVGYTIAYIVLVIFTISFGFTYIRRLLYLLFLTVIAPMVALTYPLDKIRDGKAQAFELWMKEYIINLLIQPFHLLLYTIFVSMAFELAGTNIIYSLVVLGFMIPAEKFLRSMFGFDKAKTPGFLAGPAGAAMTISAMQSLSKFAGRGPGGKKIDGGKSNTKIQEAKNNFLDRDNDSGKTESELIRSLARENEENNPVNEQKTADALKNRKDNNNEPKFRLTEDEENEKKQLRDDLDAVDAYSNAYLNPEEYEAKTNRLLELENKENRENRENEELENEQQQIEQKDISQKSTQTDVDVQPEEKSKKKMSYPRALGNYLKSEFKDDLGRVKASKYKAVRNAGAKALKSTARAAGKFATTAAGASIGVAAGIASGSPGDTLKYGTTGAYAGSAIGEGLVNRGEKVANDVVQGVTKTHQGIRKTQYGSSEYKKIMNEKKDKEFFEDVDTRNMFADKLDLTDKKDIDEAMEAAIKYRQYGITDNKVIVNAMKYSKKDPKNWASKENIAAAQLSATSISKKDFKTTMDTLKQKGLSDTQLSAIGDRITFINENISKKK